MSARADPGKPSPKGSECPLVDFDPFSDEMLSDPFPAYEELRQLAPVVRLAKYNCWATLDYEP